MRSRNLVRVAFIALLAVALCVPLLAQAKKGAAPAGTPIKVDGRIIKNYIEFMAADDKQGRRSLTPGFEATAQWAANKFKEWGVKPAGDKGTYFQDVPIVQTGSFATGVPELTVDGRAFYVKDGDFTVDITSTPGAPVSGEVVFAGYGISAPSKGLDEYAGIDPHGKIVLVFKGSPKDAPAARGMFGVAPPAPADNEAWTAESEDQAKIATAYSKGAAAVLLFDPAKLTTVGMFGPVAPVPQPAARRRPAPDSSPFTRPFLVVTDVNERVFRQVMHRDVAKESARGFSSRVEQVRRDIRAKKPRSSATGVQARIKGYDTIAFFSERLKNNVSHNVVGKVEGTDPKLKSQYVVIGGHLDHVGMTNGVVYPGADDDASGAATVMEMARLFAANAGTIKPKRTIVFALWCGEELGLLGSEYYGDHPTDGVTMDAVVANFNNDMVGLGEGLGMPGALNFPAIFDVIMRNQDADVAKAVNASTAGPGGSDYSAFIVRGIEALALMTEGGVGHPDYHDAGDTTAKIDPEILRKNGQFVLQGAINVANETAVNLLVPDRQHLYDGMRLTPLNLATAGATGMRGGMGGAAVAAPGPRFTIALTDTWAYGGNLALIDAAARLLGVGRVEVTPRGDTLWFTATEVTERGRAAVAEFERAGVVIVLKSPSPALIGSMLDAAKKPFIIDGFTDVLDGALAKKLNEKDALVTVEFDANAPAAVAARLDGLKKQIGDSDNVLLVAGSNSVAPPEPVGLKPLQRKIDDAKQQMYLALIKAGWTKYEIYATVGVNPPRPAGEPLQMPPPQNRFGGNLKKLG
jgi:hypothetical protein